MNSKTPKVEVSGFVEHIIQKFTLPKYPDLKRHHLAECELRDMRDTIEYICEAQRNACWREYTNTVGSGWKERYAETIIRNAKIERCDYE